MPAEDKRKAHQTQLARHMNDEAKASGRECLFGECLIEEVSMGECLIEEVSIGECLIGEDSIGEVSIGEWLIGEWFIEEWLSCTDSLSHLFFLDSAETSAGTEPNQ